MPYQFTQTDEFVLIEWCGEMTDEDLVALGRQMPQIATKIGYAPNVLHTFDQVTGAQIKPWSIFEHSLRQKRLRLKNPIKCAWVVHTPEVRRMGQLAQELNRNPNLTLELFDTLAAAKTWLRTATKAKKSARAVVRAPASSGAE
ncbi:hypothetical protein [Opitutus terrae]|uniref:STAS/SEC14 domain-containing protein n=1 Tax=Opitutus terrae (strain DSM 11246 / JCM 15787 / PB90-1) TaxID=452637 RepID=B2A004_OPITP|nr:hypothetical protein [Opitutus terrae]ACB77340.1 hypothetical protein Oter_4066 [Opitutus terrae PB90-1]